jgi:hypothetical protein
VAYASGGSFLSSNPDRASQSSTAYLSTTEYVRYSANFTVDSLADAFQISFSYNPTGTAGTNDWYRITGVQLEENGGLEPGLSIEPTRFKRNSPNLQAELAACQRYYQRIIPNTSSLLYWSIFQVGTSTTTFGSIPLRTTMRSSPTVSFSSPSHFTFANASGTGLAATSLTAGVTSPNFFRVNGTVASGLVAGNASTLITTTSSAFIQASSEL